MNSSPFDNSKPRSNHLIIGLGGTGGKIIRAFRKALYQEFRDAAPPSVKMGFLYVDSSDEMMALDDPSWRILGTSVQLGSNSQLCIKGANLSSILDNINNYPRIKPWIGDRLQWADILTSIIGDAVGGQKRRLGRFLFANQAQRFTEMLESQVQSLQTGDQKRVTFHIVCGLAGGTGSGSLIDAVSQIRKLYPADTKKTFRILLYTFLPEDHPKANWNTGNYHANGYAALTELNALSVGKLFPHDVTGSGARLTNLTTAFDGCYLYTNSNENGLSVDTGIDLPNIVADFLYQKIVTVNQVAWTELGRMESAENGDGAPETSGDTREGGFRSKRFLGFGVKRIAIPEEEITEYLSYSFARQAALQLRFNNWSDGFGYLPEPRRIDQGDYVKQKEQLERWLLDDEHLILSLGILDSDVKSGRWQPINKYWMTSITAFKETAEQEETSFWMDRLVNMVEQRFAEQYRSFGVGGFYRGMLNGRKERARELRARVEHEMFGDWRTGTRSIHEINDLLGALIRSLQERFDGVEDQIIKQRNKEQDAERRLQEHQAEWAHLGALQKLMGKPKQLLDGASVILQELYIARTRVAGWQFAKQFLPEILEEFADLKTSVNQASSVVTDAIKQFEDGIAARCNDAGQETDVRRQIIRFYDSQHVKKLTLNLVKDAQEQVTQTQKVRSVLIERLGDRQDFSTFNNRITPTIFLDTLEKQGLENVIIAHNNLVKTKKDILLGVSILAKLRERYPGRQELRVFVDQIVKAAGKYLTFDSEERNLTRPGIASPSLICISNLTVILPKEPEQAEFVAELKEAFKSCTQLPVEFVEKEGGKNELALVSMTNLFPLRVVEQVRFLRDRYHERIASGGERAKLEVHIEDSSNLPSLFVMSDAEVVNSAIPYLFIGRALGIVESETKADGSTKLFFMKGEGFNREEVPLGKNLADALSYLEMKVADPLKTQVVEGLKASACWEDANKRKVLEKAMFDEFEALRKSGVTNSQTIARLQEGGKQALEILKTPQ